MSTTNPTTEAEVLQTLEQAGVGAGDAPSGILLRCIVDYAKTGECMSVNISTAEAAPIIARLIAQIGKRD